MVHPSSFSGFSRRGFTLPELAVLVLLIGVSIGLLLPAMSQRRSGCTLSNSAASSIRGAIHSLVSFAEINDGRYPGIGRPDMNENGFTDIDWTTGDGFNKNVEGFDVQGRWFEMLSRNFFSGELIVSPYDAKTVWTTDAVTTDHYSYAMLDIDGPGQRGVEWKNTINASAIVISDRNDGTAAKPMSVSTNKPGQWEGSAGFNDGHVETQKATTWDTQYGTSTFKSDDIFIDQTGDDAYMIYDGR